jgi:hypothetical protein
MIINSSFSFDILYSLTIATLYSLRHTTSRKVHYWISRLNPSENVVIVLRIITPSRCWFSCLVSLILNVFFIVLVRVMYIIVKSVSIILVWLLSIFSRQSVKLDICHFELFQSFLNVHIFFEFIFLLLILVFIYQFLIFCTSLRFLHFYQLLFAVVHFLVLN